MQFKGSLGLKHFRDLETNSKKIPAEVRREFQRAFWQAIGSALLTYGRHIPVLTGDTRSSVQEILMYVEAEARKVGGVMHLSSQLDIETMTVAKKTQLDFPQEGDRAYASTQIWPTGSEGRYRFDSRGTWRDAIESVGHDPEGTKNVDIQYLPSANQYGGKYTFFFSHGPDYWLDYDNTNVHGRGPWNLGEVYNKLVKERLDSYIEMIANNITISFVGATTGSFSLASDPFEADYFWRMDQTESGKIKMGHLV